MKPVGLVFIRDALLRWYEDPLSLQEARHNYEMLVRDDPSVARVFDYQRAHIARRDRLRTAELFYVSQDMTELAVAAGPSVPPFMLQPEDLPSESGLIFFDRPIADVPITEFTEATHAIVGAAWSFRGGFGQALALTFYASLATTRQELRKAGNHDLADVWRDVPGPDLRAVKEAEIPTTSGTAEEIEEFFTALRDSAHVMTVLAALLLLKQSRMSTTRLHAFDALDRANLKRRRVDPHPVRVIQLRRSGHAVALQSAEQREYHHRWLVRGHWRQQPCGSGRVERRPVWIAPHIKGPEGAPLLTGEKVYAWVR